MHVGRLTDMFIERHCFWFAFAHIENFSNLIWVIHAKYEIWFKYFSVSIHILNEFVEPLFGWDCMPNILNSA